MGTQLVLTQGKMYAAYNGNKQICKIEAVEEESLSKEFLDFYRKNPDKVYDEMAVEPPCVA